MNKLAQEIHRRNIQKGFYTPPPSIPKMLMLMVTELAEACEADRNNKFSGNNAIDKSYLQTENVSHFLKYYEANFKGTFEEEMADVIIRVLDLCAYKNIDIETQIAAKMRYNVTRPFKHGKKY